MALEHTLYGARGSGSAIVEAALEWVGVPYRSVRAATWEPESALVELRQVNPMQQIPTLVLPDGTVLTESAACLIHLALEHPSSGLLPDEAPLRARALRALVFMAANCYSNISISDYPERWLVQPDEATNERVRAGARAQLHHAWDVFADAFGGEPFLFNRDQPCAADLMAAVVSKWSGTRKHLAASRPHFIDTLACIEAHPRIAPVLARHWDST